MTTTTLGTGPGAVKISSPSTYDLAGNVTAQGDWRYQYDKLARLIRAEDSSSGEVFEYAYDLASNRSDVRHNGDTTQSLSFGPANEIDTTANPQFAYDSAGRLISDTTSGGNSRHYLWDGASRLIGIDLYLKDTGHWRNMRMSYDTSGRLVEAETYLDLTYLVEHRYFHYDGARLIAELDDAGVIREYLYAGGEAPTAMRARNGEGTYSNYFFVTNTHGDVVAVTDRDGVIVNRYEYGPWGEATRVSEQVHQPFRYAGYRYEDGFDLYYLRARWYDAGTGRFLSRDPVRGSPTDIVGRNTYAYARSAPPQFKDHSGERAQPAAKTCRALGYSQNKSWWTDRVATITGNQGVMGFSIDFLDDDLMEDFRRSTGTRGIVWGAAEQPNKIHLNSQFQHKSAGQQIQDWCGFETQFTDTSLPITTRVIRHIFGGREPGLLFTAFHEVTHLTLPTRCENRANEGGSLLLELVTKDLLGEASLAELSSEWKRKRPARELLIC